MFKKILVLVTILFWGAGTYAQDNVGIGTTTPHVSAILDLTSTNKGFLPPRMTTAQRDAIATPAAGLVVYNTTTTRYEYYNGTGWVSLLGLTSVGLTLPSELSVSGSPLTSNGTITATWANQTANNIFAGPSTGSPAAPTFRALVSDDIPNLNASKINAGTLPVERGGTGAATLTGILKGDGTNAVSGLTNSTGNVTYWSDANTIGGNSNLSWDNTNGILSVTGVVRHVPGTAPGSPSAGMTYYNSTTNKLFLYDGTSWVDLGAAGGGSLPAGTTNQTLRYGATDWEATNTIRATTSQVAIGSGTFTPTSVIHSDAGDATAHYHKFTAGTTTNQTATDGFDIGINNDGHGIINQREELPVILSTNSVERMRIAADGKVGIGNNNPLVILHLGGGIAFEPVSDNNSSVTVGDRTYIKIGYEGTVTLSAGVTGQILVLHKTGSGNATLTDGTGYKLTGNWVGDADDTITLIYDGTDWVELSRSLN